ncbi:hypothetical protein ScPMuIL_012293 [Solemya velum]
MGSHTVWKIALIFATCILYVVTIVVNGTVFYMGSNKASNASNQTNTEVTSTTFTHIAWVFVYVWQAIWLMYSMSTLWRVVEDTGEYVYQLPVIPPLFYVFFILNLLANIGHSIACSYQNVLTALYLYLVMDTSLCVCLFLLFRFLYLYLGNLAAKNIWSEAWYLRFFVHNGVAYNAAWSIVSTLIHVRSVLKDMSSLSSGVAGTIWLVTAGLLILSWFLMDTFIWDNYVREVKKEEEGERERQSGGERGSGRNGERGRGRRKNRKRERGEEDREREEKGREEEEKEKEGVEKRMEGREKGEKEKEEGRAN